MPEAQTPANGFSLFELIVVVAIVAVVAGMAVPLTLKAINGVILRNEAVDFSGLVQTTRMQAVRKNTFYSIVPNSSSGNDIPYFADLAKTGTYASGDPVVQWRNVTVFAGTGSGAPSESGFVTSLGFNINAGLPTMDARGLPCAPASGGATCPETPGFGFIIFFSNTTTFGSTNWAALVVTPSGRAQIWSYSGGSSGTWFQG